MNTTGPGDLIIRFYDAFDRGDIDAAIAVFSEQLETIDPGMGTVHGLGPFRSYLERFKRSMPDAHVKVERMCFSDDTAIVEARFVATHTGPLASADGDIPPTGSNIDLGFADIVRAADGQIASYHTYYDQLSLLTQLGLMGGD